MEARLSLLGSDLLCQRAPWTASCEARIALGGGALERLRAWAIRYHRAIDSSAVDSMLPLGQELFRWLDESGWATAWADGAGTRTLEVAVDQPGSEAGGAVLDVPWELLARQGEFLTGDATQPFVVFRSIARPRDDRQVEPEHRDLALMFMAASPEGQRELAYEAEEAAILRATERLNAYLFVEESGCGQFLRERLAQDAAFEVVHLSCHGDIQPTGEPVLAFETPEGKLDLASPGDLAAVLGERKPPLVFLSACRTAEAQERARTGDTPAVTESFVRALVRAGVANVLGWDGSVNDLDATQYARTLYAELAGHRSVPYAAARARNEVLRAHQEDPHKGRHWHLARVYAGSGGGGALCARAKPRRQLQKDVGYREFLDRVEKRVPVASAQEFVGRRRQVQAVLRALEDRTAIGVLIWGMGNLGKSSLAARVANRMPRHQTAVVYGRYDALSVFDRLLQALQPAERAQWERDWRPQIATDGVALGPALEAMLTGPFNLQPILLVIDDLEQILEKPQPGQAATPVATEYRGTLQAVLRAFEAANTESRLLLTSRFDFSLPDGKGRDLASLLERVQLRSMEPREREKQWRAVERAAEQTEALVSEAVQAIVPRIQAAAGGNPGLQAVLSRPVIAGELEAAERAVAAVERWKVSGELPQEESAAQEFFQRVSLETYLEALSEPQRVQLRAATLFEAEVPVPVEALEAAGWAAGVGEPAQAITRLRGLGLIDGWDWIDGVEHAAANPLARPLVKHLTDEEEAHLAAAVVPVLARVWRDTEEDFPYNSRGVEAARLCLLGKAPPELINRAATAAASFLFHRQHDASAALRVLSASYEEIELQRGDPTPELLLLGSHCAERVGEREVQLACLERGLTLESDDAIRLAWIAAEYASATVQQNGPVQTLERLWEAVHQFEAADDVRSRAVTLGKIADILAQKGEIEEALRIFRHEQLPTFERLGDVRERAVTLGQIADTLAQQGEIEEALRIRREEELPVYERLGTVRERAITMGQIADILAQQGETQEALRIRREEQLPVFERLGDVRSRAVTVGKIANILAQQGETEEALRIRREEQLPVFEHLGDVRSRAITLGSIADILTQQGETEEALRIRREEQLPVFERLGDVRSRAVTMGQIADILAQQGETQEALRIRREEQLPVFEHLGDVRSRAITLGSIADILTQQGETEEALRIRREEELPVYERLRDVRSRAITLGQIADILARQGETQEALRIFREEVLPAATSLKDVNARAHALFSCARLRLTGQIDADELQAAYDELAESFAISLKLGRVDGIAAVGSLLGQVSAAGGKTEDALKVLEQSAAAFDKLHQPDAASAVRSLHEQIKEQRG